MKKLALAISLSACALPAAAEFQPGFSAEILFGEADHSSDFDGGYEPSEKDSSKGIRFAYAFNENFAIEASYHDYGKAKDTVYSDSYPYYYFDGESQITEELDYTSETSAINLGFKASLPFSNGLSFILRAGLSKWDYEISQSYVLTEDYTDYDSSFYDAVYTYAPDYGQAKADDDGHDYYYGLGAEYSINQQFFVAAEYTVLNADADIDGIDVSHEVKNLSISLGYKF
ncbi:porin family protein [Dasania sp. GY-MA-18]|uniref:Porin family protein n=1 Tax=Dasania phycosphaerae TaxID=2950436 RepID=A0A9J6RKF6_9GAMM|nr:MULTISPECIES: porin family protein [Dasania]MCR8922251.1 porin family protein [Dasania sp. GY-MA-18]MCZ0864679.1 porin family protein [Dasania phycosphaerae]MCZ0868407.1 porin family protein [Dasania phycosphaerae]